MGNMLENSQHLENKKFRHSEAPSLLGRTLMLKYFHIWVHIHIFYYVGEFKNTRPNAQILDWIGLSTGEMREHSQT